MQTNPQRRRATRLRAATWSLLGLTALGTTAGAVVTGWAVFEAVRDPDQAVTATTSAPAALKPTGSYGVAPRWVVAAAWTDPHGIVHRGSLDVSSRLAAGVPVAAGLTPAGDLRHEPPPAADAWVRALLASAVVEGASALLLWRAHVVGLRRVEQVKLRSWDRSWAEWSTRPERQNGS